MTPRRLLAYVLVGGAVYAAVLFATLPVSWVAHGVEMASERRLLLRNPAGSAWAGSGRIYARQRSGTLLDLGAVRWKASRWALAHGKLAAEVSLGNRGRTTHVEASFASLTLRGLDLEFPGAVVAGLAPELAALAPEGAVRVRSDSLRIERDSVLGLAEIEWRALRISRPQRVELGSHLVRLRGAGARVHIELGSLEGPMQVSGGGTWSRASGLVVSGSAVPRDATLAPFLKAVCAEYRESRCYFKYSGV